jgi:hypothetical protein
MKLATWLLNPTLYFHKNAEPISSGKIVQNEMHIK